MDEEIASAFQLYGGGKAGFGFAGDLKFLRLGMLLKASLMQSSSLRFSYFINIITFTNLVKYIISVKPCAANIFGSIRRTQIYLNSCVGRNFLCQ